MQLIAVCWYQLFYTDWRSPYSEKENGAFTEICQWWLTSWGGGVQENAWIVIGWL